MKFFTTLTIICLIAVALAVNIQQKFDKSQDAKLIEKLKANNRPHFDVCIKRNNVAEKDATKYLINKMAKPSTDMKCFGSCFFEEVGTWKDGVVQEDIVLKALGPIFGEKRVKNAITTCRHIKGTDRCETMDEFIKCYVEA